MRGFSDISRKSASAAARNHGRGILPARAQRTLAVAGLFVCEPHAAAPGEAGLRIEWREAPALY